jgi:hypothetical protein
MPFVGKHIEWSGASTGKSTITATWTYDFPPAAALAMVIPSFYMEYSGAVGMMGTRITSFRRRLPSGADETVSAGNVPAVFDPKMTSVTYGLFLYNCQGQVVLDLGFWV